MTINPNFLSTPIIPPKSNKPAKTVPTIVPISAGRVRPSEPPLPLLVGVGKGDDDELDGDVEGEVGRIIEGCEDVVLGDDVFEETEVVGDWFVDDVGGWVVLVGVGDGCEGGEVDGEGIVDVGVVGEDR